MKHAPLFLTMAAIFAPPAYAAPAATVLFAQSGAEIMGADGKVRPAVQGDVLATGERLTTRENAISQLLLTDGSLISMRPASELKIDTPVASGLPGAAPSKGDTLQMISLVQGAVRVIGSELMDKQKPSSITLQTGQATVKLNAADLESAIVRPGATKSSLANEAGSYNRLQLGTGSIQSGTVKEVLVPRQVSFVGAVNAAPVMVAAAPPSLFASNVVLNPVSGAGSARTSASQGSTVDSTVPATSRTSTTNTSVTSRLPPTTMAAINPALAGSLVDTSVGAKPVGAPISSGSALPLAPRTIAPLPIAPFANTPLVVPPIVNTMLVVPPIVKTPLVVPPIVNTLLVVPPIVKTPLVVAPIVNTSLVVPPIVKTPLVVAPIVNTSVVVAPIVNSPVVVPPIVSTPVVIAPIVSTPVVVPPIVSTPVVIAPIVNTPVVIAPIVSTPVVIAPIVNTPVVIAPIVNTPVVVAPIVNTPVIAPVVLPRPTPVTITPTVIQPKVTCTPVVIRGVKTCI